MSSSRTVDRVRRALRARGGLGPHVISWAPLTAFSIAIFCASSVPLQTLQSLGFSFNDKLVHLQVYGLWGVLGAWGALRTWPGLEARTAILLVGAAGLAYGVTDELHQTLVPGRAAELGDLAADLVGALLGAAAIVAARGWVPGLGKPARPPAPADRGPETERARSRAP